MQSAYLYVILHVRHKNYHLSRVFTKFLIILFLVKTQDEGQDGDHCS